MATVLLLTATYIKDYTFVDPNVDEKYIRISIEEAQKIHIRNYIGSGLYNEIISQVQSGSLTALNTTLLDDYIIPALKWWTMVEAAPFLTYKVTNKNIVRKNSDNSTGVEKLMTSGSGYEKTIASLALRSVLSKICSLPKPNVIVMDEVFGKISNDNLEMVYEFFIKIKDYFEKIFVITHNPLISNWADNIIRITKTDNISTVKQ